jgi:hypothetical protein
MLEFIPGVVWVAQREGVSQSETESCKDDGVAMTVVFFLRKH